MFVRAITRRLSKGFKWGAVAASQVRADIAFAVTDVMWILAAYSLALGFRALDPLVEDAAPLWLDLALALPVIVIIHLAANIIAGAYGHVWEYASTDEARRVVFANAVAGVVILVLTLAVREQFDLVVPLAVVVLGNLLSLLGMGMVRFRTRVFSMRQRSGERKILIAGNGSEAASFARKSAEIEGIGRVVGFVGSGDHSGDQVRRLAGLPILGSISDIADLVTEHDVDDVIVVGSNPERVKFVVDACMDVDVRLRILPLAQDVMLDHSASFDLRDIRVEDLLVRAPVATDLGRVAEMIRGKSVLVTGAGGSIGSELVAQILEFDPAVTWALDRDESLLHQASLNWPGTVRTILGDVTNAESILRRIELAKPDVIFHSAALKHVPVLEAYPEEAVLANVIGTRNVIEAGSRCGMEAFVLISTDKAVDPASVMGASKRVAEMLVQTGSSRDDNCRYSAVRFGNVLGSRGSVIPTFVQQITKGGPVTVTDPNMTRYFMTVNEAVQLVLQAASLSSESDVLVLDMGEPVQIDDLARRLIRLAGLTPDRDIEVKYTGVRPGEKLSEILSVEPLLPTELPKVFRAPIAPPDPASLLEAVAELEDAALTGDTDVVLSLLGHIAGGRVAQKREVDIVPDVRLRA